MQQAIAALSLCELIDRGLVHEVWLYLGSAEYARLNGPVGTILELKPQYDENRRRRELPGRRLARLVDAELPGPRRCLPG